MASKRLEHIISMAERGIKAITGEPHEVARRKESPEGAQALLIMPFALTIIGISALVLRKSYMSTGEQFAPAPVNTFLLWLIIFAMFYSALIILFYLGKHEAKILDMKRRRKPRIIHH